MVTYGRLSRYHLFSPYSPIDNIYNILLLFPSKPSNTIINIENGEVKKKKFRILFYNYLTPEMERRLNFIYVGGHI